MLHLLSSIGGVLIGCALIGIIASDYVKLPPNVAYIISGINKMKLKCHNNNWQYMAKRAV